MADKKISEYTPRSTVIADTDGLYKMKLVDTVPVSEVITLDQFQRNLGPSVLLTPPIDANFAWVNQGGATVTLGKFGIALMAPFSGAGTRSLRIRDKAAPATPYTIVAGIMCTSIHLTTGSNEVEFGVGFRNAAAGTLAGAFFDSFQVTPRSLNIRKYTNPTTFSADYLNFDSNGHSNHVMWIKLADDGVNRIISISADGYNFIQLHSVGRTDFLTADRVFFGLSAATSALNQILTLISWKEA